MSQDFRIVFVLFPRITQLDFTEQSIAIGNCQRGK